MKKGFTFVELLLVMLILGIIITLTMPLVKNLVNNDDVHRAYMKKAIQDVTSAYNLASVRTRNFTVETCNDNDANTTCNFSSNANLRNLFKLAVTGTDCSNNTCLSNMNNSDGLNIGSKVVMQFTGGNINNGGSVIGKSRIYYDVNGAKGPNQYCQDRYVFLINNDNNIELDPAICASCANLAKN